MARTLIEFETQATREEARDVVYVTQGPNFPRYTRPENILLVAGNRGMNL